MPDVVLVKNRVEPGKVDRLREWMAEIRSRQDEALETLEHEGMIAEAAFLEQEDDEAYLYYYMDAEDIDEVYERFTSSPYQIDREHKEVMDEVLAEDQPDGEIDLLYHLVNPKRR